jgi:hypothetical protein
MKSLVGNMTCPDIVRLVELIDRAGSTTLRQFAHNQVGYAPPSSQLIADLQALIANLNALGVDRLGRDIAVITAAIRNLQ